jgi:hypothetical protein
VPSGGRQRPRCRQSGVEARITAEMTTGNWQHATRHWRRARCHRVTGGRCAAWQARMHVPAWSHPDLMETPSSPPTYLRRRGVLQYSCTPVPSVNSSGYSSTLGERQRVLYVFGEEHTRPLLYFGQPGFAQRRPRRRCDASAPNASRPIGQSQRRALFLAAVRSLVLPVP